MHRFRSPARPGRGRPDRQPGGKELSTGTRHRGCPTVERKEKWKRMGVAIHRYTKAIQAIRMRPSTIVTMLRPIGLRSHMIWRYSFVG